MTEQQQQCSPNHTTPEDKIIYLEKQIKRLSDQLREKQVIINKLMDVASGQHKRIASLNHTLLDTVIWDPHTCPSPSCSTPQLANTPRHTNAPSLPLSNRFTVLTTDSPSPAPYDSHDFPPLQRSEPKQQRPSKASARRKILEEAVQRRSRTPSASAPAPPLSPRLHAPSSPPPVVPRSQQAAAPSAAPSPPRSPVMPRPQQAGTDPVSPRSQGEQRPQQAAAPPVQTAEGASLQLGVTGESASGDDSCPSPGRPGSSHESSVLLQLSSSVETAPPNSPQSAPPPLPLFPPSTIIIGDSIIRNVRFFNATTHCFPGATVTKIVNILPDILQAMPSSIHRIVVHVGTNDMPHAQSEATKRDFNELFNVLKPWIINGLSVFVSGPLPALYRGDERFSRTRNLNTWLNFICRSHHIHFIDNFNLFWNRPSLFRLDGLHLNRFGSRILTDNFLYTISTSTPAYN